MDKYIGSLTALGDIADLLDKPQSVKSSIVTQDLEFKHSLSLKDVSFRYSDNSPATFVGIELTIKKEKWSEL